MVTANGTTTSALDNAGTSSLITTVDGRSGLSTASAVGVGAHNVRSRSRSPHPESSTKDSRGQHGLLLTPTTDHLSSGARDAPVERGSLSPDAEDSSVTNISSDDDSDTLRGAGVNVDNGEQKGHRPSVFTFWTGQSWEASKGLLMVITAMFFSSIMGATARLLQTGPDPMHTFQILFARQSVTAALSMIYMHFWRISDAPLGRKEVRPLLVARGIGGFWGVYGLYYSVQYLPLAEATVITFLAPCVANAVCALLLKQPFTRRQQIAGAISLLGVVFIARPFGFLGSEDETSAADVSGSNSTRSAQSDETATNVLEVSSHQRLLAILVSLVGVCGAACAYTTIRAIGKRAHPLISVNYFSVWCTFVALMAMIFVPGVHFRLPANPREWGLLLGLGTSGIIMQYLLTAGLAKAKGSSGTNATYTQMIFVLLIDYAIWGTVLTWASWLGAAMILISQIWGAMASGEAVKEKGSPDRRTAAHRDEEVGLVQGRRRAEDELHEESDSPDGVEMRLMR